MTLPRINIDITVGKNINVLINPERREDEPYFWIRSGVSWADEYVKMFRKDSTEESMKFIFDAIYSVRWKHDYTVGGDVHIIKITRENGVEWIQNPYR